MSSLCKDAKFLRGVFQVGLVDASIVNITLREKLVYQIAKDTLIKEHHGSVLATMIQSGMQEDVSHTINIADDHNIYTPEAVKLFFGALSCGSEVIQHSCFTLHELMVLPLLVQYFCVDSSIAEAATSAMASYPDNSIDDIDNAIIVINIINVCLSSLPVKCKKSKRKRTATEAIFACLIAHREVLLGRIACTIAQQTHTLDSYKFWSYISMKDLEEIMNVIQNIVITELKFVCNPRTFSHVTGKDIKVLSFNESVPSGEDSVSVRYKSSTLEFTFSFSEAVPYNIESVRLIQERTSYQSSAELTPKKRTCHITPVQQLSMTLPDADCSLNVVYQYPSIQYQLLIRYINAQSNSKALSGDIDVKTCLTALRCTKEIVSHEMEGYRCFNVIIAMLPALIQKSNAFVLSSYNFFSCTDMTELVNACVEYWNTCNAPSNAILLVILLLEWVQSRRAQHDEYRAGISIIKLSLVTLLPIIHTESKKPNNVCIKRLREINVPELKTEMNQIHTILDRGKNIMMGFW